MSTTLVNWVITIGVVLTAPSAAPAPSASPSPGDESPAYYTVQVMAAPTARKADLLQTCESLKAKGYLAYCCDTQVGGRPYTRLRTGVFQNRPEAQAYAEMLHQKEGFDYFVIEADVFVDSFRGQFHAVTTPGGIWLMAPGRAKELYEFDVSWGQVRYSPARFSPTGKAIAFCYNNKLIALTLSTGQSQVLKAGRQPDELLNSVVRWSPDGLHLAYLDTVAWEAPTKLWVMRTDGSHDRPLVAAAGAQTKVKSFRWHPHGDRIFYVAGPAHGTVSVGGSLYRTDLSGKQETVVAAEPDKRTEVSSEFHIVGHTLYYKLAHFDANHQTPKYTLHNLTIGEPH